jgi:hypothetical protein
MKQVIFMGRLYTCDPQDIYLYEQQWVDNLKNEIQNTSPYQFNYLINITWIDRDQQDYWINWIDEAHAPNNCKIWISGSIDSVEWITNSNFYKTLEQRGYEVTTIGYSKHHWHSWFPYYLYDKNQTINTTLQNIKYLYLNYNRKPKHHRFLLVDKLRDHNLLHLGYVTFQQGYYSMLDELTGNTELNFHDEKVKSEPDLYIKPKDLKYSRPEDVSSLGNLDIWNNTYLIIVSETEFYDPYHLSEKTWKPIIGSRPFVLNGNYTMTSVLKKLGFYTPSMLFDNEDLDSCSADSIIELLQYLKTLNNEQLMNLYNKQLPMIEYNYKRFVEIATGDRTKILNWSQSKML